MPKSVIYTSPAEVERAFYEAFERADLDAMMSVWAEDEEVVCVHPTGARLTGFEQIRKSWAQLFRGAQQLRIKLTTQVHFNGMLLAIHSVHENITVSGESRTRHPLVATNVYMRTSDGWRMVLHHASPVPEVPARGAGEGPKTLH
jgi:uncharacterized protein (TIGR02246 family)